jgi:hypothetical protein
MSWRTVTARLRRHHQATTENQGFQGATLEANEDFGLAVFPTLRVDVVHDMSLKKVSQ